MAEKNIVLVGGDSKVDVTAASLETARRDAEHVIQNSAVIRQIFLAEVALRQLFLLMHANLDYELKEGWDMKNPALVLQILGASAQERAVKDTPLPSELKEAVTSCVLPILEIFCKSEVEQNGTEQQTTPGTLPGSDDVEASGLDTVCGGTGGDAQQEA